VGVRIPPSAPAFALISKRRLPAVALAQAGFPFATGLRLEDDRLPKRIHTPSVDGLPCLAGRLQARTRKNFELDG
jgi:hypothetical protein